ncbi:MAG: ATP-binding protein, partial [Rhodoferax sp.]|nr:ATP-binding protein [Rhodoferax sp.]
AAVTHREAGLPGWALTVTDQGRGVAQEARDKVFTPFFTTRKDGTGLGLTVVQHVALLHGGYVTLKSEPGCGTEFALWLPETPAMTLPADPPNPPLS